MEDRNSLPGTSRDDEVNEKNLETGKLKNLASFMSDVLKKRLNDHKINNEEIFQILHQYSTLKLSQILEASKGYMEQCGRSKFTLEDFNKGLISCGQKPVKKYTLPAPKKNRRRKPKKNELSENVAHHVYINEWWLNDISPFCATVNDLPVEFKEYFDSLKKVIFLKNKGTSMILNDLSTNTNLIQLVPHLVNFFCDAVLSFKVDFLKISILLKFLSALLENEHLYFGQDSYLNSLACVLLKYLAADLPHYNQDNDCWSLKDNAADLLAIILRRSRDLHLFFEAIRFMETILSFENSLNSHYGAVTALNSIGVPGIFVLLPSYNDEFQKHAETAVHSSYKDKIDFHMVKGQIVRSYYILVDYYYKTECKEPPFGSIDYFAEFLKSVTVLPIIYQLSFSDCFGEALHPSVPFLNCSSHSFFRKNKAINKTGKKRKTDLKKTMNEFKELTMI